jgi:hypothetical protein
MHVDVDDGGRGVGVDPEVVEVERGDGDLTAVSRSLWRQGSTYPRVLKSLRICTAPSGGPSPPPASFGQDIVLAGRSATHRCQKPLPVGASGS